MTIPALATSEDDYTACRWCRTPTRFLGARQCDGCWELSTRISHQPDLARRILELVEAELTPPGWMKTPPAMPGWYWYRGYQMEPRPLQVAPRFDDEPSDLVVVSRGSYYREAVDRLFGFWWPARIPLPPVDESADG